MALRHWMYRFNVNHWWPLLTLVRRHLAIPKRVAASEIEHNWNDKFITNIRFYGGPYKSIADLRKARAREFPYDGYKCQFCYHKAAVPVIADQNTYDSDAHTNWNFTLCTHCGRFHFGHKW